jgi:hypothetical protein
MDLPWVVELVSLDFNCVIRVFDNADQAKRFAKECDMAGIWYRVLVWPL